MPQLHWKWPESFGTSGTVDWKRAEKITAGIDIGTTGAQAAIFCDGVLFGYANLPIQADFSGIADTVLEKAMGESGMSRADIRGGIAATGWGAGHVSCAAKRVDEVQAHAKGARFMFGDDVRTVLDMGGQTIKAIRLYDWERVRDFAMNDKCATGMGRNIEVLCDLLQVPITEIGVKSLEVEQEPVQVSTTCAAFANTETMGLFGRPEFRSEPLSENQVYASHLYAAAWRILGVLGRIQPLDVGDITAEKELCFTGGLAKNPGITSRIERELGITAKVSEYDPQLAGAIGAALLV